MSHFPNWYVKNLGDAMLAESELERIKKQFQADYDKAQDPGQMAIFMRHESEGRLHCEVTLYFSPATANVAKSVNAQPCNKPPPGDLGLFAGHQAAWLQHFGVTY